ncbi:MAG: tetratricopeptide repeat protein [Bacteroidales bacterium]|jgi:tetratricopeptide (TPR) repeat protein|nr:tetratricopeptide repeat protein [Bacteroidales bacterium]
MKRVLLFIALFTVSGWLLAQQNPCPFKYGANETDSLRCVEDISAFRAFYAAKGYKDMYASWREVVTKCPCSWSGIFSYAPVMFDNLIKMEQDSARKQIYIDSLLWTYEVRHLYSPQFFTEGQGLGEKARALLQYRMQKNKEFIESVYDIFSRSLDMEKSKSQPAIINNYFQLSKVLTDATKDTTIIIEAYEKVTEYIDEAIHQAYKQYEKNLPYFGNLDTAYNILHNIDKMEYDKRFRGLSEDTARQMKLVDNYQKTLKNVENTFTPYAPCSVLVQVYSKKIDNNRDNMAVLQKMVTTMWKRGDSTCINSAVFQDALELLHQSQPGAQSAYLMGNFKLRKLEYDQAISYFKEALNLYETNEQKVDVYYTMGLTYMLKGADFYADARESARAALRIKPSCGKAHILIGDLYAMSAGRCSGGNNLPLANNWAAADQYNRAVAVDASCAAAASEKLRKLTFPSTTDKHARGLNTGDSYTVGCWINETTRVR